MVQCLHSFNLLAAVLLAYYDAVKITRIVIKAKATLL